MQINTGLRLATFAGLVLILAVGSSLGALAEPQVSAPGLQIAMPAVRAPDAFYMPPASVPQKPGTLLRSEEMRDVELPAGLRAWRILYTTTTNDGKPVTSIATIFGPATGFSGPRPVVMWEHGTTGVMQRCMPSLVSQPTLGIPALANVAAAGWVIVATDYPVAGKDGPIPYVVGEGEARAGLDSVRAARHVPGLQLDNRTVVWGHSQGGHAALWTGIIASRYAPDVNIAGVAAIAPATDLSKLLGLNPPIAKMLGPYVALSYSSFYPDITFDQVVRPDDLKAAREMAQLCSFLPLEESERIGTLAKSFNEPPLADGNTAFAARLAQNTPDHPIAAPLLIAQGLNDRVVLPTVTEAYVDARCAAGQRLDYWKFSGIDHSQIVLPGPLDDPLATWTAARFAGKPQTVGCKRR